MLRLYLQLHDAIVGEWNREMSVLKNCKSLKMLLLTMGELLGSFILWEAPGSNAICVVDILQRWCAIIIIIDVLDHTPKTRDDPPRLGAIGAFLWRSQTTWFPSSNILKALPSEIAWIMPPNRLTIKSCDSLILFYFFLGFSNDIDRHVCFVLALGHSSMQSLINNKGVME